MKITLVSPVPSTEMIDCYGVRILSSCLKREGYDVQIIFLPRIVGEMYEEQTLNEIVELSGGCDLIGISLMTDDFPNVVQITQRLKRNLNIPIVWGGIHPTLKPEECLGHVEMICMGEGEETLVELVRKMNDGQSLLNIQGMWFKDKGEIVKNKLRPLNQNLNSIPFPDNDLKNHYLLIKNHYILANRHIHRINENLLRDIWSRCYITLASRGCPYSCTYCWNHVHRKMYTGQQVIRKRNTDNIIEELKIAKSDFPFVQAICLHDDLFFVRTRKEITDFARKYKEDIRLPLWIAGASPSSLTKEKLSVLVEAGLEDIRMGIQTASERTKKLYKRHHTNQQVEEAARIINEFKDKIRLPKYDIILDNPWETDEDLIETLKFLARLPVPYQLILFSLNLYPGTELYEKAKRESISFIGHHLPKKTYLNNLFFLLRYHVPWRRSISPRIISLLTNPNLRKLKISWCLYMLLKTWGVISFWIQYYFVEGFKEIRKGNWSRIIRFGKRFYVNQKRKLCKHGEIDI